MSIYEVLLLAIGLSMDSFAVSICKGISFNKVKIKDALKLAMIFSLFQGTFPLIGYFLGDITEIFINKVDHWISFGLLVIIGFNMIKESKEGNNTDKDLSIKTLSILGISTSIDAMAVGITFAFEKINLTLICLMILATTFIFSLVGYIIGSKLGIKLNKYAKIIGGLILIFLGLKILIEHLS